VLGAFFADDNLNSVRTVDVAFFISQSWTYDEQMEQVVKDKLRPGGESMLDNSRRTPRVQLLPA
jgi:hypothetical protein